MSLITRVPATISPDEFRERFELPELPVVIEGGARHFRASSSWNPAYLKEKLGGVRVPYKCSTNHQHPNFHAATLPEMFRRGECSLAELVDFVTSAPPESRAQRLFTGDERFLLQFRSGRATRDPELGPLLDDVELPRFVAQEQLYTIWGWLSGAGVRTWLHYDNNYCHNFNAQITGRKQCALYSPSSLHALEPFLLGGANPAHNCSRIDVEASELPEAFRKLEPLEASLTAGDLLFIPVFWFHTFLHLDSFNTNVNFWWRPTAMKHSPVAARQALLDAARSAGLDATRAEQAELLRALDSKLVGAVSEGPAKG